ncbi:hypothetical protein CHS0354_004667 [Potamilus streckersoni]|uniref:Globin domain-containing protein n=1 Tax=Potamilus streckersoni TaxID=2493646 RepID=A0AAE0S6X8_9BIVA|nr:hypothetical protein CHS0354_004667 [Potamilus streckersoni]
MADVLLDPAPPAPTDPRLPFNARQIFKLQKSWKGIKRNLEATGVEMFVRMFRNNDDLRLLFTKFRNLKTVDELRLDENVELHGKTVMDVIDEVISNIENVDYVLELMKNTGRIHRRFAGFTASYFWHIEKPFLEAVKITLGDRYSDNMDVIYKIFISFLLKHLEQGMTETNCVT